MTKLKKEMLKTLERCEMFLKNKCHDNEVIIQEALFIGDFMKADNYTKLNKKIETTLNKLKKVKEHLKKEESNGN